MTKPVADPAIMAIRVDSLDCAAEHAGLPKPKHSLPASNQRSLKMRDICCGDRDMDSQRLQLLDASVRRQPKCVRFELNFLSGPEVMSGLAWWVSLLSEQHNSTIRRLRLTTKLDVRCSLADFGFANPRGTQPRSVCASLAADHLPLANVILRIDIRVENGGLFRRS